MNQMWSNNVLLGRGRSRVLRGSLVYHEINHLNEFIVSRMLDDGVENDDVDFVLRDKANFPFEWES